ncbi:MAG: c-type cytochrome [Acidimicrobiia bacterium]|nr:MAG: c-type cytochrome [Acidimicrobiia bacterium]
MTRAVVGVLVALLVSACAPAGPTDDNYIAGRTIYRTCAQCHGSSGEGGVGRALGTVRETFPDCDDHIEWISLGSEGWQQTYGSAYGATNQPIEGAMPAFDSLNRLELAQVAVYERVRFGGGELADELATCGF